MPLSDDEQRILREIEANLKTDERFAQKVSSSGLYLHAARTVKRAAFGLVVALVGMVLALQVHFLLSFVVFVGMLGLVVVIERQLRLMGRAGVQDITQSLRNPRVTVNRRFRNPTE
ncbi:MAG: DUF3040 domain-containing protein [Ilumatobacteraceae bacterium]